MDTLNLLTLYFAKGIAIYMIVTGIAGLLAPARWRVLVDDLNASPGLTYISGAFVLLLGIALVFPHFFWSDPLAMIVSFICLMVLVEGMILMIAPGMVLNVARRAVSSDSASRLWAIIALVAGLALLVAAMTGRAGIA